MWRAPSDFLQVAEQIAHHPNVIGIILDEENLDALAVGAGTAGIHRDYLTLQRVVFRVIR